MFLGLDIGTGSIKAVIYDPDKGKVTASATRPTPVSHPRPEWSEHDPESLWLAVVDCIREAAGDQPVSALAISSMAETGVLLDLHGQPLYPIIAWYDRRSEPQAAWIEERVAANRLYQITGQRASPSFGITKILWMKQELPDVFSRAVHWLPVSSYIYWRLTGQMTMDYSIAARTLAFDQAQRSWSRPILDAAGIPAGLFPPAFPGASSIGPLNAKAAQDTGLGQSTVCILGGHDHLCASFAAGAHHPGAVVDSTGSANAVLFILSDFLNKPELAEKGFACYPYILPGQFVLKGGLKAAGSAVDWLARLVSGEDRKPDFKALESQAAQGIGRRAGPIWLPHLIGSGTPQGDRFSRAAMVGVQFEHDRGDILRGLLESLAFWTRHNMYEMQSLCDLEIRNMFLTGGTTRIALLSQLKANVLNLAVQVPEIPETAATGAALIAGLGAGAFASPAEAVGSLRYNNNIFPPEQNLVRYYDALYREAYLPLYQALDPIHRGLNQIQQSLRGY